MEQFQTISRRKLQEKKILVAQMLTKQAKIRPKIRFFVIFWSLVH